VRSLRVVVLGVAGAAVLVSPFALLLGPSNERDGFKVFLGKSQDELVALGTAAYPDEDGSQNHPCHRFAARLAADRYGVMVALGGGVLNEVAESLTLTLSLQNALSRRNVSETLGDLGANWRGVKDSALRTSRP
jgi:hypothetical protein